MLHGCDLFLFEMKDIDKNPLLEHVSDSATPPRQAFVVW